MRVAVSHQDPDHPHAVTFAYRLGRAQDGTDFVTGEDRAAGDTIATLLAAAKEEYPESEGYTHEVQTLVDNGDDTSSWVAADAATGERTPAGEVREAEHSVAQEVSGRSQVTGG